MLPCGLRAHVADDGLCSFRRDSEVVQIRRETPSQSVPAEPCPVESRADGPLYEVIEIQAELLLIALEHPSSGSSLAALMLFEYFFSGRMTGTTDSEASVLVSFTFVRHTLRRTWMNFPSKSSVWSPRSSASRKPANAAVATMVEAGSGSFPSMSKIAFRSHAGVFRLDRFSRSGFHTLPCHSRWDFVNNPSS